MSIRLTQARPLLADEDVVPTTPDPPVHQSTMPATNHSCEKSNELPPASPFLSLNESAVWLCVSLSTLKRMIAKGTLSTIRVGARQKIPADVLSAYVARDIIVPSQVIDIEQSIQD